MSQFCIMSDIKERFLTNEQAQDLIGHLVAAIANGSHWVTLGETECAEGCHTSIMVNGERAAMVNL
jgi:hypothetical protein